MSGQLVGNTRWGREAIDAMKSADRAAIEEAIPDGMYITVGAARSKGDWTLALKNGKPDPIVIVYHQQTLEGGSRALLQLAAEVAG